MIRSLQAETDVQRAALRLIAPLIWRWFDENRDGVVREFRVLFWTVTIRVSDLEPLFVRLFGQRP